ncbi:MAG: prepilin-type N-terminal cleavage/methylation domain-containing protein [Hyphomicrobiaceae bacterium]
MTWPASFGLPDHARSAHAASERGFSLIELLVSLALLVMLLALLPNALGLGRRAWETHAEVGERLSGMAGLGLIEQRLAEAMPAFAMDAAGNGILAFRGEAEVLSFVAPSRTPTEPGLARWTLSLAADSAPARPGRGRRIVLTSEPFPMPPAVSAATDAGPATEIDASGAALALAYFGRLNTAEPPQWFDTWPRTDALPSLVAITLLPDARSSQAHPRRIVVELKLATP